jgi:hypothetical protein
LALAVMEDANFASLKQNQLILFLQQMNLFNQKIKSTKNKQKLKEEFVTQNYALYKNLFDYDVFTLIRLLASWEIKHPAVEIAKRLHKRCLPKEFHISEENVAKAQELIDNFKQKATIQDWQLTLLQLPHLSYQMSQDPILLRDSSGNIKYLHDNSLMIHSLSDKYESVYIVCVDAEIIAKPAIKKLLQILNFL